MAARPKISDDDLAMFIAEPVPRRTLHPAIRRAALGQSASLFTAFFGAAFGTFGLLFVLKLTPWNLLQDFRLRNAPTVIGRVESVSETKTSIKRVKVLRYDFSYQPPSSPKLMSHCFTTGNSWAPGDRVKVRYLPEDPTVSCVESARLSETGLAALLVWVFPLAGYSLLAWTVITRRRTRELLHHGFISEGTVTAVTPTSRQVNKSKVYAITVQRSDGQSLVIRQHQGAVVAFAEERLASKRPVYLLTDPRHPQRSMLPETWPDRS